VNVINYRLDGLYHFTPESRFVPFLAAGVGGTNNTSGLEKHNKALVEYGLGAKYFVSENVALRGDVRHIMTLDHQWRNNLESTVGLAFYLGKEKPAPAPAPKPAPTADLTVAPGSITKGETATLTWNSRDASNCDIQPGVGPVPPQGSRTITPAADTSYTLTCSGEGGTARSTAGLTVVAPAPKPAPPKPTSSLTVTPASVTKGNTATLSWTSQNATKCDIQPNIGEVPPQGSRTITPTDDTAYTITCTGDGGTAQSNANVTVVIPPEPKKERVCITLAIEFKTGKADIQPKYHGEIGKVAEFMKKYPEANGVIEGHTDNVGGKDYNLKLSDRRAESVRNYLVEKYGIDANRLSSKGYGFSKPIASNATAEGRQKNRRIQATFDCVIIQK
ncbi:MAG TPA: OmpA family protein, partial [Geobacteraceae bacterium]